MGQAQHHVGGHFAHHFRIMGAMEQTGIAGPSVADHVEDAVAGQADALDAQNSAATARSTTR